MSAFRDQLQRRPYLFAAVLCLVLLVLTVAADSSFANPRNWDAQFASFAPFALVALASTPSILSGGGGLDLSIGPLAGFINVLLVTTLLGTWAGGPLIAVPMVLLIGAAVGAINGVLVTRLRFLPVIATLCTFFVLGGASLALAEQSTTAPGNWTGDLTGWIGPIPTGVLLAGAPLLLWSALRRTAYLENLYAVGGDDAAAYCAGVDVERARILAYAAGGLMAAVAGLSLTAILQSTNLEIGSQYTLIALAAVAVGGTPLGGGRGGMLGSVLGAASIYLLQTFLSAAQAPVTWLPVAYGIVLAAGVVLGAQLLARPAIRGTSA